MAIFDLLDVLNVLDISSSRLAVPIVVGIGSGIGVYYLSGETPASAAMACALDCWSSASCGSSVIGGTGESAAA